MWRLSWRPLLPTGVFFLGRKVAPRAAVGGGRCSGLAALVVVVGGVADALGGVVLVVLWLLRGGCFWLFEGGKGGLGA
jgi:hypothetical protein